MTQTFKKLPGVLSFNRCHLATDALLFNEHEGAAPTPLLVIREGLRGTQNVNSKTGSERDVSNVQITDSAKTAATASAVIAKMAISYHPLENGLNGCALGKGDKDKDLLQAYRQSYLSFLERAIESEGLKEVSRRFARRIANGSWLWRNRKLAAEMNVTVVAGDKTFSFDGLKIPMNHFNDYSQDEADLGLIIRDALAGENLTPLKVTARISFGDGMNGAIQVYPSQNYLSDKPKGFARSLYYVGPIKQNFSKHPDDVESAKPLGQAAIRDTKVTNALRTIDTWYPEFDEHKQIIAVEPVGANLDAQRLFRTGPASAFAYAKQLNTLDPSCPEGMFMIASLLRGGVYSEGKDE